MTKNTSVEIGEELALFVNGQVKAGRYQSASEVIRAGLRALQDRETQMAALRAAVQAGIDSGPAVPFDFATFEKQRQEQR